MLGNLPVYAVCSAMHFEDFGAREPAGYEKNTSVWSFTPKQVVAEDEDYVFV